ncbi:MAG: DUF5615 family PIN-like protein [Methylococcaceae bacterium]
MRFLVDAQLPPALTRMIAANHFEAEHVYDVELGEATDTEIWEYAKKTQATIITKDEDFVVFHSIYPDGPSVIWIRIGNTTKQALLEWFEPLFPAIVKTLERGDKLVEVV